MRACVSVCLPAVHVCVRRRCGLGLMICAYLTRRGVPMCVCVCVCVCVCSGIKGLFVGDRVLVTAKNDSR